jgi:hypothetical protein
MDGLEQHWLKQQFDELRCDTIFAARRGLTKTLDRTEALEREVAQLKLLCHALVDLLEEAKVLEADKLQVAMQKLVALEPTPAPSSRKLHVRKRRL